MAIKRGKEEKKREEENGPISVRSDGLKGTQERPQHWSPHRPVLYVSAVKDRPAAVVDTVPRTILRTS